MRRLSRFMPLAVVLLLALVLAGCPGRQETSETEAMPPGVGEGTEVVSAEPEPAGGEEAASATLTKETIKNFMASMEDEKIEEVMDGIVKGMGAEDDEDPETIRQALEQAASNPDLDEAVKAHGFSSGEEWVATAKKVLPGFGMAMVMVMAQTLGIEEGSEEYEEMMEQDQEDDFAAFAEAFEAPTEEEVQMIVDVLKEKMEEEGNKVE